MNSSEVAMHSIEPWFSVEEISKHLGVSKETIYRWLERKKIPSHRIGKLWKFKPSEVDEWIRSGDAKEGEKPRVNHDEKISNKSRMKAKRGSQKFNERNS